MKKLLLCMSLLVAGAMAFAGSWKPKDLDNEKKFSAMVKKYNLNEYKLDNPAIKLYKSNDGNSWVYLVQTGSEEKSSKSVIKAYFAVLDGQFDSLFIYGGFTAPEQAVKYLYAALTESSTTITTNDFYGRSPYTWSDPSGVYCSLFLERQVAFNQFLANSKFLGISVPGYAADKYAYFEDWLKDNDVSGASKELKKYLKANPYFQ